jgi:hypothetical protein
MNKILEFAFDSTNCTLVAILSIWGILLVILTITVVIITAQAAMSGMSAFFENYFSQKWRHFNFADTVDHV